MNTEFAKAVCDDWNGLHPESVLIYTVLRADIEVCSTATSKYFRGKGLLVSGLDVQTLASKVKLNLLTVQRRLDDLFHHEWIKFHKEDKDTYYKLGDVLTGLDSWFIPKKKTVEEKRVVDLDPVARMRLKIIEDRKRIMASEAAKKARMPDEAKRGIAEKVFKDLVEPKGRSKELIDYFKSTYRSKYGEYPDLDFTKMYVYIKRFIDWCTLSGDDPKEVIYWSIMNWARMYNLLKLPDKPTLNMICTKSILDRIVKWKVSGVPVERPKDVDGVGKRADEDAISKAKDVGW